MPPALRRRWRWRFPRSRASRIRRPVRCAAGAGKPASGGVDPAAGRDLRCAPRRLQGQPRPDERSGEELGAVRIGAARRRQARPGAGPRGGRSPRRTAVADRPDAEHFEADGRNGRPSSPRSPTRPLRSTQAWTTSKRSCSMRRSTGFCACIGLAPAVRRGGVGNGATDCHEAGARGFRRAPDGCGKHPVGANSKAPVRDGHQSLAAEPLGRRVKTLTLFLTPLCAHSNAQPFLIPRRRKTIAAGQKPVKGD